MKLTNQYYLHCSYKFSRTGPCLTLSNFLLLVIFLLEDACFCSWWLLTFIVNSLHPFFALNHSSHQPLGPKDHLHHVVLKLFMVQPHLSMLSGERWQPAEQVLPKSSFLPSSQRIMEQLASQWKLLRQTEASPSLKITQLLLLLAHSLLPFGKQQWKHLAWCCTARYLCCPLLLPLGISYHWWKSPWHNHFWDLQTCLYNVTLQCNERPLPPWQHAPSHSSFVLSSSPLLFHSLVFARLVGKWTIT